MAVKAVFTDIDGTLTINRSSYVLSIEAINALRKLVEKGIVVSLVSSNALPVVIGLSRYIGLNGPVVGESGALVYHDEWGIVELASAPAREAYLGVLEEYGEYVEDSWQNRFRIYEYALKIKREYLGRAWDIVREIRGFVESRYEGFTVDYSGYAIHIHAKGVSKGTAVRYILDRLGVDPGEAMGIGDSVMDAEFIGFLGYRVAVGGADEGLVRVCNIVLSEPSGLGVAEVASRVLGGLL